MRAEHDGAAGGVAAVASANQITAGIDVHFQAGLLEAPCKPGAALQETWRERAAGVGLRRVGDLGKRHHVRPQPRAVDRKIVAHQSLASAIAPAGWTKPPLPGWAVTCVPSNTACPRTKVATGRNGR